MTAPKLIELLQHALRNYRHKNVCQERDLTVVTNPVTGQLGVQCLECKTMAVLTDIQKAAAPGEEPKEEQPKPRFKV